MREIVVAVSTNGRVTIPARIRRLLGIEPGDRVSFVLEADGRVMLRRPRFTLESVRGSVPALPGPQSVDFDDQIEEAMADLADEIVRRMGGP